MYLPAHFAQPDAAALHGLLRAHPLATLVSSGADGLTADHMPLEFDPAAGAHGTLFGHVARANPLWRHAAGQAVLAVFQGAQAYVSPNWYPGKATTHRVVPTWNYAVVHAHGVLQAVDDAPWLRALVGRLTHTHEHGRTEPWSVDDAPVDYVQQMLGAIVGIQIPLTQLVGKWKASQNRSTADRAGVAAGLRAEHDADAQAMAALVQPPPP